MLALAKVIDKTAMKYDVDVIVTPQYADIKLLADNTERILVFAQHMDALVPGRGLTLPGDVRKRLLLLRMPAMIITRSLWNSAKAITSCA